MKNSWIYTKNRKNIANLLFRSLQLILHIKSSTKCILSDQLGCINLFPTMDFNSEGYVNYFRELAIVNFFSHM